MLCCNDEQRGVREHAATARCTCQVAVMNPRPLTLFTRFGLNTPDYDLRDRQEDTLRSRAEF